MIYHVVIWSSRGLVVRNRMHDLHTVSRGFKSQKSQRWWQELGRASDLNSLLSSDKLKVSLLVLTMEQTPRPRTGNIGSINKAKKCFIMLLLL